MNQLEGYSAISPFQIKSAFSIYRAKDSATGNPIFLKIVNTGDTEQYNAESLKHEYSILRILKGTEGIPGSLKLLSQKQALILSFEDIEGLPLDCILRDQTIDTGEFLKIGIMLTKIVGKIHDKNIIHKNLNPSNIIRNRQTDRILILDYSQASRYIREKINRFDFRTINKSVAYISPEQTGRMNRFIDYRSDYYSLGVIFFEMLTGRLPFEPKDPVDLIYSHIAIKPESPDHVVPEIPVVISEIIMKLLEKSPEKRYQSAFGILKDLEKCYFMLKERGKVFEFDIAQCDKNQIFHIPDDLYGRKKELRAIEEKFSNCVYGTKEIFFLSGPAGIGKSSLAFELQKKILQKKGIFIDGKFDEYENELPYSALIQAFSRIINEILNRRDDTFLHWRNRIIKLLGHNGQVIVQLIPELEKLIGKQPEPECLPVRESQNRFVLTFLNFIKAFTGTDHPLVLFLDDLQWADHASLNLLQILFQDEELHNFMFMGAFRRIDLHKPGSLAFLFDTPVENGISFDILELNPLNKNQTGWLLADTLRCEADKTSEFAGILHSKTNGNPFFLKMLLNRIYKEGQIVFSREQGCWLWDLDKIKKIIIAGDLLNILMDKIRNLGEPAWGIVKIACCIGDVSPADILIAVYGKEIEGITEDLKEAFLEGIIIQKERDYQFIHDKVREAAYNLIEIGERAEIHYKIGSVILRTGKNRQDYFAVAGQWNEAVNLLNKTEKKKLITLNLKAGMKAKNSSALNAATKYFKSAVSLLDQESWKSNYSDTFILYKAWAETEYILGNIGEAEVLSELVIHMAKNVSETVSIYEQKISYYFGMQNVNKAISTGKVICKKLGFDISYEQPGFFSFFNTGKILKILKKFDPEKIKIVGDAKHQALINILISLIPVSIMSNPYLVSGTVLKCMNLQIEKGFIESGIFILALYAIELCKLDKFKEAVCFYELAHSLASKNGSKKLLGRVNFLMAILGGHLIYPYRNYDQFIHIAEKFLLTSGDFEYLGSLYGNRVFLLFFSGKNLSVIKEEVITTIIPKINRLKSRASKLIFNLWLQGVDSLSREKGDFLKLNGTFFNEDNEAARIHDRMALVCYHILKSFMAYTFKHYYESREHGLKVIEQNSVIAGFFPLYQFYLIHGLTLTALYSHSGNRKKLQKEIFRIHSIFEKLSECSPSNFLHKYHLLCAEWASVKGRDAEAMRLYNNAISGASEQGLIYDEAIANECAAGFYKTRGIGNIAAMYIRQTWFCFNKWGCLQKVALLVKNHPFLRDNKDLSRNKIRSDPALNQPVEEDIRFGDSVVEEMSILFSDIREFTRISEKMQPEENFKFINSYLGHMEPKIVQNNGFIDKYIGDAIIALFRQSAGDAVSAGINMLEELKVYNNGRRRAGYDPIKIGIGINTSTIIPGTTGSQHRIGGTVLGDAVNLASRVEGLTRQYDIPLLISFYTYSQLKDPLQFNIRFVDIVQVKGKSEKVPVFEVFNTDPEYRKKMKINTKSFFEKAVSAYYYKNFDQSRELFKKCLKEFSEDNVAQIYLDRCNKQIEIDEREKHFSGIQRKS